MESNIKNNYNKKYGDTLVASVIWLTSNFIPAHKTLGSGCQETFASVLVVLLHHRKMSDLSWCRGTPEYDLSSINKAHLDAQGQKQTLTVQKTSTDTAGLFT